MTFPAKTIGQAAAATAPTQEAVMGQAIPRQHPAVVLRSHFNQIRALLAVAMVAVVGLTIAVVILATDDDAVTGSGSTTLVAPAPNGSTRYDGGPNEGSADVTPAQPKVTQQQAFPGLANQAREAQAGGAASPSKSATKDYSLNGATGDVAPEPKAQSGSGSSDDSSQLRGPGHRTN
jgi:hypothetical protein